MTVTQIELEPVADDKRIGYESDYHKRVYGWLHDEAKYFAKSDLLRERFFPMVEAHHRVFEYGLGLGVNLAKLPATAKEGYDISNYARDFCAKKGIKAYSSEDNVPSQAYDIVISSHCLEHLESPADNLNFLKTLLADGGKLVLVLPIEKRKLPRQTDQMDVHQHLYAWSLKTINNLLIHCGYEVLENAYITAGYLPYRLLRRRSKFLFETFMKLDGLVRPLHRRHMRIIARVKPTAS